LFRVYDRNKQPILMAHYKVILAYDGTHFSGSQRQAEARTVQGAVEVALRQLNWNGNSVLLAGRTDAGVHASGQVISFELAWGHSPGDLQRALNALLPEDVAARSVSFCGDEFHPRYDAVARSYQYLILCDPVRDPLKERYAWRIWPAPDLDRLCQAARIFLGTHDYASFGSPTRLDGSTVRTVMHSDWLQHGDALTYEVTANAFLYHMVRRFVNVQVAVGQGKLELEVIRNHLNAPAHEPIQGLAPPQGLTLVKVNYSAGNEDTK
jgi:tRNA pseudouridine38-40 synthase